jgi:hypothetical protein
VRDLRAAEGLARALRISIGSCEQNDRCWRASHECAPARPPPVLFVDRDGTLIEEPPDEQVDRLDKIRLLPGVFAALPSCSAPATAW